MHSFRSFTVSGVNYGELTMDGQKYELEWKRNVTQPDDAPRLLIISHITNPNALELLKTCVEGVQKFTPEAHELWVIDNNSPQEWSQHLKEIPSINLVFNRTEPRPPEIRKNGIGSLESQEQFHYGSYANAIGLEIGAYLIESTSSHLVTMHMDTMPTKKGWLSYLKSKLNDRTAASGVRMDNTRTKDGVLHVLGYMVDFQVFRKLGLSFFPQMPDYDVGDKVTIELRQAGYNVFACRNTFRNPELEKLIPLDSPLHDLHVDRSFDDCDEVIFLHLGRGVRRSSGNHTRGTSLEEWLSATRAILDQKV